MFTSKINPKSTLDKLKYTSVWWIVLGSLIGCQAPSTTVQEISVKKTGKTINLKGKVTHIAPFVTNAAYQLEDHTGKVWVVTEQNFPQLGQQINIKGKIEYQSLPFAEQELGDLYIVELEQLASPSKSSKK